LFWVCQLVTRQWQGLDQNAGIKQDIKRNTGHRDGRLRPVIELILHDDGEVGITIRSMGISHPATKKDCVVDRESSRNALKKKRGGIHRDWINF
jgi:hypothetical protein